MNKKIVTLLIVLIAAVSIASVCAAELTKEQDFDGLFKMKVADDDNFTSLRNGSEYTILLQSKMAYKNNNGSIYAFVYDSDVNDAVMYASHDKISNFDKDGNLTVFNVTEDMNKELGGNVTLFAGKTNDKSTMTVFIGGNDEILVKEYAKTIKFD